jgi:hypothetical protein
MFASVIFAELVKHAAKNTTSSLYFGFHFSGDSVQSRRVYGARNIGIENI